MADRVTSLTLLERARGRDEAAWERLVHLYAPLVRYWCGRWGLVGADAEDVTQETFAAAAAALNSFRRDRPGDTFRGWLRGVTRHKLLEHLRRQRRSPAGVGGTDAQIGLAELPDTPVDDDAQTEMTGLYHRSLELVRGEFEPNTWTAFWRVAVDSRPTDAVAAQLGMSTAAVRMAKSRVLRRLREEIGDLIQ